jgi:gliding motility-associated-like protein
MPNDTLVNLGDSFRLYPIVRNLDTPRYTWLPNIYLNCGNCLNPISKPQKDILYRFTAFNTEGCQAEGSMMVRVETNQKVYIPNVFSPNGDSNNEYFTIFARNISNIKTLRIFNKWGEMVFEKQNFEPNKPELGWNGMHRDIQVKPDVYVYYAEIEFFGGEIKLFKGDVTLMR